MISGQLYFVILFNFSLFILGGCSGGKVQQYNYYILQGVSGEDAVINQSVSPSSTINIGVEPVMIPAWLDHKNMIFSDGGVRLIRHEYDSWMEPLSELLTQNMVQNLRLMTKRSVTKGPWVRSAKPETIVAIEINSIAIVDGALQMETLWRLSGASREYQTEARKTYLALLPKQGPYFIAVALSRLLGELAKEIRNAI